MQPLVHQFVQRFAEHIGFPDLLRIFFKFLQHIADELFRLLFRAHNGIDLGLDARADHVNGLGRGAQFHPVTARLLDDFRLLERQLVRIRHHDAVTGLTHILQRARDLVVGAFCFGKFPHQGNKVPFVGDRKSGQLAHDAVVQAVRRDQRHLGRTVRHVQRIDLPFFYVLVPLRLGEFTGDVPHFHHAVADVREGVHAGAAQPVVGVQIPHPHRQGNRHFGRREFLQNQFHDVADVLVVELHAVQKGHRRIVLLFQRVGQRRGFLPLGVRGVQNDGVGFILPRKLLGHPFFRLHITVARDLADTAVGGHQNADGGMLPDDAARADLGRLAEGDRFFRPRRVDHARLPLFALSERFRHDIAHAVDHFHPHSGALPEEDVHRLVRDEFRLRRHHGLPGTRLRQFIHRARAVVLVRYPGDHRVFHEFADKSGFARAHRADDADVDIATRAGRDILVDGCAGHFGGPPFTVSLLHRMRDPRNL